MSAIHQAFMQVSGPSGKPAHHPTQHQAGAWVPGSRAARRHHRRPIHRVIAQPTSTPFKPRRKLGKSTYVKQTGTLEGNEADVLFSTRLDSPARPLSLEHVQELVKQALGGIRNAPPIRVVASIAQTGIDAPDDVMGVTARDGRVFVTASSHGTGIEVFRTSFHELFHDGLQNVVPAEQYAILRCWGTLEQRSTPGGLMLTRCARNTRRERH